MLFQRKKVLKSVANGKIVPLSQVPDEVFSSNMMGVGYAVTEHDGKVYSPADGIVEDIFPTLHAITIKTNKNVTVLIHMGLDTVDLKGAPFELSVKKGDQVFTNQLLAEMDLDLLNEKDKNSTVVVVLPDITKGDVSPNEDGSIKDTAFKF